MKFFLLFLISFVITLSLTAQVVNTEKLRLDRKDKGWVGELDLNLGLTRNKAGQTLQLGSRGRVEYMKERHRFLLFGAYNLTQFNNIDVPGSAPKNFVNNRFAHIRYNYRIKNALTLEAFIQSQVNEIQEIDWRFLSGIGPRFRLIDNDSLHLFLGALYMYEYEESNDLILIGPLERERSVTRRDHRLSAYVSAGVTLRKFLIVNHTTYFQPRFDDWADFRISSETSIGVQVTDRLRLNTFFLLMYDTRPPIRIPKTMYMISNGLGLAF